MIINNRVISNQELPYIIAELSANHNGSIERAFESILAAKEAGADAVKIQTYTADTMTIDCGTADFQVNGGLWDGYKLYDLYKEAQTPYEWHKPLFDYAREEMNAKYPILVTFINKNNPRSFQAHTRKLGLEVINEFEFNNNQYYELVYDTSLSLLD